MRIIGLLVLTLALAAAPLLAQSTPVRQLQDGNCNRVALEADTAPAYTLSGAWTTPDNLVLLDAVDNNLLSYGPQGRFLGKQAKSVAASVEETFGKKFLPVAIESSDGVAWVEIIGTRFAKLAGTDHVIETKDLWGTQFEGGEKLVGIWSWTVTDNELFGFGDFLLTDESKESGFFRVNFDDTSDSQILSRLANGSRTHLWYRLGFPLITSIGRVGYALEMEERLSMAESFPEAGSLGKVGVFTGRLRTPPALQTFKTPDDLVAIMGNISSATAPVGLHSQNGKLYLVWRHVGEDRREWLISRIDPSKPASEALETTVSVNSKADHLMVIPGSKYWAFVEKGPVKGYMAQSTNSVLFAPSAHIRNSFAHDGVICGAAD